MWAAGAAAAALAGIFAWRLSTTAPVSSPSTASLYDLTALDQDGRETPLAAYRGQVAGLRRGTSRST
jgi:hypothetical protein